MKTLLTGVLGFGLTVLGCGVDPTATMPTDGTGGAQMQGDAEAGGSGGAAADSDVTADAGSGGSMAPAASADAGPEAAPPADAGPEGSPVEVGPAVGGILPQCPGSAARVIVCGIGATRGTCSAYDAAEKIAPVWGCFIRDDNDWHFVCVEKCE